MGIRHRNWAILIVFLLVCGGCVAMLPMPTIQAENGDVFEERDEFKGVTFVRLKGLSIPTNQGLSKLDFNLWILKEGSTSILFMISTSGGAWQYLKCHLVDLLADGVPIPISETRHDGSVGTGGYSVYVLEHVMFSMDTSVFKAFATAKEVRGRLCTTEFTFTPGQLEQFRKFGERIGLITAPSAPSKT